MKFRKKPVVVEAVQLKAADRGSKGPWDFDGPLFSETPEWLTKAANIDWHLVRESDWVHLKIKTLEGDMIVSPGDWIIKGVNGEIYPCKPDIFEKTYEPVSEEGPTP